MQNPDGQTQPPESPAQRQKNKVQRFVARDMSSALRLLTGRFGADAILLASRRVNGGVEVAGLPAGSDARDIDPAQIYAERRHSERRAGERRARDAAASEPATSKPIATTTTATEPASTRQQQSLGESLARLRSDYASLLDDLDDTAVLPSGPVTSGTEGGGVRRAASELAQQIDELGSAAQAAPGSQPLAAGEVQVAQIQQELKALKTLLTDSLASHARQTVLPQPAQYVVMQRLRAMGFAPAVTTALLRSTGISDEQASSSDAVEPLWSAVREQLLSVLPVSDSALLERDGVFALLGAAGAGKSSVLAMLLAQWVDQQQQAQVAVISLEGARSDLVAGLAALAGITYLPVDANFDLAARIAQCARFRTVFIDTGCGGDDSESVNAMLAQLRASEVRVQELLLLPATGEPRYLQRMLRRYRSEYSVGCILTFYDQVAAPGEIFSLLMRERLDVVGLAIGAVLPEHLLQPDRQALLEQLALHADAPGLEDLPQDIMAPGLQPKLDNSAHSLTIS
ncbi:MAG: hypothetical protein HKO71_00620 [Pseudomonadales bacterium]|nr:hypothetical protein [Pseudomonadales bacterium]